MTSALVNTCQKCGGAIFPPNIGIGWGGPICHCALDSYQQPVIPLVNTLDQARYIAFNLPPEQQRQLVKELTERLKEAE